MQGNAGHLRVLQSTCVHLAQRSLFLHKSLYGRIGRPGRRASMLTVATFAQPTVLLTNDDGPDSPFFQAWVPYVRDVLGCAFLFCTDLDRAALSMSEFETVFYESLMAIIVAVL